MSLDWIHERWVGAELLFFALAIMSLRTRFEWWQRLVLAVGPRVIRDYEASMVRQSQENRPN